MLWREGYDTRRLGDLPFSPPEGVPIGTALIVAAGIGALPEFGVWTRLVESDFGPEAWRGLLVGDRVAFEEALPSSRLARCEFIVATNLPLVEGRVLAGVVVSEGLRSVMIGPPTEEAWGDFAHSLAGQPVE